MMAPGWWVWLGGVALVGVLGGVSGQHSISSASLALRPPRLCQPTEIVVEFETTFNLTGGDEVSVSLAGFTSGACDNNAGDSIVEDFDEVNSELLLVQGYLQLRPSQLWQGAYQEGNVISSFSDSRLYFTLLPGRFIDNGTRVAIHVDAGNGIKVNCGIDSSWNGQNHSLVVRAKSLGYSRRTANASTHAAVGLPLNFTTPVAGGCPITDAQLDLDPPLPKIATAATIRFIPGMEILPGDNVTIRLGGFTSGNATGFPGSDLPMGQVEIATSTTFPNGSSLSTAPTSITRSLFPRQPIFNASWREGDVVRDQPGFTKSTLTLFLQEPHVLLPGTVVTVYVNRSNGIRAQCGLPANSTDVQIGVTIGATTGLSRSADPISFPATPRGHTEAVGDGCRSHLNYCSGHGVCDHCLNRCTCMDGYGSNSDLERLSERTLDHRALPRDCSGKVCPTGPGFSGVLPHLEQSASNATIAHLVRECSGAGLCDRTTGSCDCFQGWTGTACSRRDCPTAIEGLACSGHGQCLSMRGLALTAEALPLSRGLSAGRYANDGGPRVSPETWDAEVMHACVCDSSWEVGLGQNQTQVSEWYGPDCSRRRCPSGDDPLTSEVNEEDCSNVTAAGGRGAGQSGNQCQVECSNRGRCDSGSGLCQCFEGFAGANCGTQIREK